jgi:hypothetical protein
VQLLLVPREGQERYVARVAAQDNVPRGVACQGQGEPGAFTWRGDSLRCPVGWQELPLQGPRHHSER